MERQIGDENLEESGEKEEEEFIYIPAVRSEHYDVDPLYVNA